jgi:hypothetical protein
VQLRFRLQYGRGVLLGWVGRIALPRTAALCARRCSFASSVGRLPPSGRWLSF